MRLSLRPITTRLRARAGRHSFDAGSVEHWEISPAVERMSRAAPCLPDDPDRIFDQPSATADQTRATLNARTVRHEATYLSRYRNVDVIEGALYADRSYLPITSQRRATPVAIGLDQVDQALICTTYATEHYFGHWLIDGMILETLAEDHHIAPVTLATRRWMHESGYRDLLGRHDRFAPHARIAECLVAQDRGINDCWIARVARLRATVQASVSNDSETPPVFLSRGAGGSERQLINECEVQDALSQRGFRILEPEKLTPIEIVAALHGAPLIVAVEGSHQTHAILAARAGSSLVTIMPPRRASAYQKNHADALSIGWAYTVADDRGDGQFYQSTERLFRVIDLADADRGGINR